MKRVWALFKKELRTYFNSPIAYIVVTMLLVGIGYFFFQTFFIAGQATLRSFFRFAAWSFVLFAPAITMKLFAEEKRSGTVELLFTLPVREWEVVLGKFLAGWALLGIYLLVTLAYPFSISHFGNLDPGPVVGGYVGLFLLGGTFVAIGVFASAITTNQVISLILAVALGLLLFILDILLPFFPEGLQSLVEYLGADSHFKNIGRGIMDTRDLVYSLSFIAIFLFLAVQALQTRMTDHSFRWKLNRGLYLGAALGCVAAVNILSYHLYGRADLTQDKRYTLSESSRKLVSDLDDQLLIKAYFSAKLPAPFNNHARYLRDQLAEYRNYAGGRLTFQFVDPSAPGPDGKPDNSLAAEARAAGIPKVEVNKIAKDQVQVVKVFMGLALYYRDKVESIPVLQSVEDLEFALSTRIAKLTRERTPRLGILVGHGEKSSAEGLTRALGVLGDKFDVADVDLSRGEEALAGIDVLVVAGPKTTLPAEHLFWIDQFIMKGGKAAFFIDRHDLDIRSFIGYPLDLGLSDMLKSYGVEVRGAMVLDQRNQKVAMTRVQGNLRYQTFTPFPPFVRVGDMDPKSPLVKNLRGLVLPFVSPLKVVAKDDVEARVIARSSKQSWLFENEESFLFEPRMLPIPGEEDMVGPQALVVTLSGSFDSHYRDRGIPTGNDGEPVAQSLSDKSPETRIAVVGSSAWLADAMASRLAYVFFANLMDWVAQDERMIHLRTRAITNRPLKQTGEMVKSLVKYGNMLGLPLGFAALGVMKWRLRLRRKRKVLIAR